MDKVKEKMPEIEGYKVYFKAAKQEKIENKQQRRSLVCPSGKWLGTRGECQKTDIIAPNMTLETRRNSGPP